MSKLTLDRRQLLVASVGAAALAGTACTAATHAQASEPIFKGDLKRKSILITGCSSGFGRLMAESFAQDGAQVFASMRNLPRSEAEELRDFARENKLDLTVVEIDVTDAASVEAGVGEVLAATDGKLDALINNAGIGLSGPLEFQDAEATQLMFETNTFGPHRMSRAVLPAMRAQGSGHIVNISSQLGRVIIPYFGQYSATKFALEAASEQLAYELVPHGIGVTIIQPGGYPTEIWRNRNALAKDLKARLPKTRAAAYPDQAAGLGEGGGGGDTDPMDVPRAIAAVLAKPLDQRPLRVAVHPGSKPQVPINTASAKAQSAWLGESGYGPMIKAVNARG